MNEIKEKKEYTTDMEFVEQNLIFLNNMYNKALENTRSITSIIADLQDDLKAVKTPELKPVITNMINQHTSVKKQNLELIKRSRKDLGFFNSIYKKMRMEKK